MPGLNGVENFVFPTDFTPPPDILYGVMPKFLPLPGDNVTDDGPGTGPARAGVAGTAVGTVLSTPKVNTAGSLELEAVLAGFKEEPGRGADAVE